MLGIDMLGGAKYVSNALKAYGNFKGYAVGMFWNQFGDTTKLIKGLMAEGCNTFRIHLLWDSTHTYSGKQKQVLQEFKRCMKVFSGSTGTHVLISPYCEHRSSYTVMTSLMADLWDAANSAELATCPVPRFVNTPANGLLLPKFTDKKNGKPVQVINEIHVPAGTNADAAGLPNPPGGRYTVSPDGWNLTPAGAKNYNKQYSGAFIRFAWDAVLNNHPQPPTSQHITAVAKLLE